MTLGLADLASACNVSPCQKATGRKWGWRSMLAWSKRPRALRVQPRALRTSGALNADMAANSA
eukprot:308003-Lingulodinium_polyedra.AAC.1